MTSTFHGLETARRGLTTQQAALYVVGQNVANANTLGYSRQRVNMAAETAYPNPGMNREQIPGQMGTGVKAGSIQRVRESFLDVQYRSESTKLGYWTGRAEGLSKIEDVMDELKGTGLSDSIDSFWQSIQDLATNSVNSGGKAVVRERGIALADTFTYLNSSLNMVRSDLKNELNVTVEKANSMLGSIDQLNKQIAAIEPHGYLPNDLYDSRDLLIDELSSMMNIKVDYVKNGGNSQAQAMGSAVIKLNNGTAEPLTLVDSTTVNPIALMFNGEDGAVDTISIGGNAVPTATFISEGMLLSLLQTYGYTNTEGKLAGDLPDMIKELDHMAYTFATEFNKVHKDGLSAKELAAWKTALESDPAAKIEDFNEDILFFTDEYNADPQNVKGFASRIRISDEIKESYDYIANASVATPNDGDASNLLKLADVFYEKFNYKDALADSSPAAEKESLGAYLQSVIGTLAVKTEQADRLSVNSATLLQNVSDRRSSVSAVSLDEEMTNMVQFQQAYNASARMITMIDECLDKIINGLGVGGR
ncbi:flagellar hook-associated protein FlgK [Bacillus sp. D386]|uniref:flagellar hook-associated protein FlgK n=1 Tax=Bacillus sp. D386 TaxID=2587155 RepID=UPI00111EA43E|nr:flagellar hook-associated protein FlgK [Bacillus sp. D386]